MIVYLKELLQTFEKKAAQYLNSFSVETKAFNVRRYKVCSRTASFPIYLFSCISAIHSDVSINNFSF